MNMHTIQHILTFIINKSNDSHAFVVKGYVFKNNLNIFQIKCQNNL
jgi:hypothetical protein